MFNTFQFEAWVDLEKRVRLSRCTHWNVNRKLLSVIWGADNPGMVREVLATFYEWHSRWEYCDPRKNDSDPLMAVKRQKYRKENKMGTNMHIFSNNLKKITHGFVPMFPLMQNNLIGREILMLIILIWVPIYWYNLQGVSCQDHGWTCNKTIVS